MFSNTFCCLDTPNATDLFCTAAGEWDGTGAAPELASCSHTQHLTPAAAQQSARQKLVPGKLVFSYGVEWRRSNVHWDIYLSLTLT